VVEGEGKTVRQIKFASERDLERSFVRRYIQAAIELVGAPTGGGTGKSAVRSARGCVRKSRAKRPGRN
jgi:hypothetical protein